MDYRFIDTYVKGTTNIINAVIEIPKGTHNKYEVDPDTGDKLTIVRTLNDKFPRDYKYPFNYGFIPSTLAPDNDQLDVIVISNDPIDPLTIVPCKVVGIVRTVDNGEEDDKVIAVPVYSTLKSINLKKIVKFLKEYKYPDQEGTTIGEVLNAEEALKTINKFRLLMSGGSK